jgi:hypothetical protein
MITDAVRGHLTARPRDLAVRGGERGYVLGEWRRRKAARIGTLTCPIS